MSGASSMHAGHQANLPNRMEIRTHPVIVIIFVMFFFIIFIIFLAPLSLFLSYLSSVLSSLSYFLSCLSFSSLSLMAKNMTAKRIGPNFARTLAGKIWSNLLCCHSLPVTKKRGLNQVLPPETRLQNHESQGVSPLSFS